MKNKPNYLLLALWLALALALTPVLRAASSVEATEPKQETPAVKAGEETAPPPAAAPPAAVPVEEKSPAPGAPVAAAEETGDKLRELDAEEKTAAESASGETKSGRHQHERHSDNERISLLGDSTLAAGEQADAVVSILGSSTSAGEVRDAVVSVIGDTRVTGGTVGGAAVAVLGNNYINGHVKGAVVAVLGNLELGPDAVVDGEMVCVGGEVIRDPKAVAHGNVQHIAIGGHHFNLKGVHAWFSQCLLYARPLAFDVRVLWAWWIALAFLGFYALVALVTPAGVTKCAQTLEERPGYSILSGVLTLLLTPVAYLLLVLTLAIGIGFALIPIFSLGLFIAGLFGKAVMLAWLGRRITRLLGDGLLAHPVFAVLIGGVIVLGLYTVPILGFVVYKLLGVLGLGVVAYTLLLLLKSSRKAAATAAATAAAAATPPPLAGEPAGAVTTPSLPPVISAATLPRVGFWLRLLASLLDAVMVGIVFGMLHTIWHGFGGVFPFWYAVYCVAMWATKGTTIGGIICGLKVVRVDDRPVDWSVAVVRALSAFLSLAVAGLGFIWVVFDDDKQSWHDKIAGTTIVKVPKGTPLL